MTRKKPEVVREVPNTDGSRDIFYSDGTSRHIDPFGNLPATVTDAQIEAWRKAPKEQALKEALELFKMQGMDVSEARVSIT